MINAVTDYHSEWPRHDIIMFCVSATQRCNIVSNGYNTVPTLKLRVAIKIVVANHPV